MPANSRPVLSVTSGVTCWVQLLSIMTRTMYCVLASSPCSWDMVDIVGGSLWHHSNLAEQMFGIRQCS